MNLEKSKDEEEIKQSNTDDELLDFGNFDDEDIEDDDEQYGENDYALYIITDKYISGMLEYFRHYGLNVSRIFLSVEDARDSILMQLAKSKLVIIDTGSGKLSSISAREQIYDILGLGSEDNKIKFFYSDKMLKSDSDNEHIEWIKYKSTSNVLAMLLQKKGEDNYIETYDYMKVSDLKESLDYKGKKVPNALPSNPDCIQLNTSHIVHCFDMKDVEQNYLQEYAIEL